MFRIIALPILASFLLLSPVALALPQEGKQADEGFTTGPVFITSPDLDRVSKKKTVGPGYLSPPDGNDILANVNTTNAQNETSVAVNPLDPNNIVAVANDYSAGGVQTGYYTTLDGGATWLGGLIPLKPGFSFSGDPCVTFDANGDAVIVCMQYSGPGGNGVYAYKSLDKGQTFNNGVQVDLNSSNDKPQVAADHSNGPYRGDVSTAWDRFSTSSGSHIYFSFSRNGTNWSPSQRLNDMTSTDTIAPDVAYAAGSVLHVMWADRGSFDIWVDTSFDGGQTWGTDSHVARFTQVPSPIPGSSFRMFDIFAMDADKTDGPYSGNVYVAYHTWVGTPKHADIRCATSTDQGSTWSSDVLVNHDDLTQADQVMPGAFVDPQGNVNISFYDRRLDPGNYLLWTWVARSSDGGANFMNYRASDVGWDHNNTEFGFFIGDYIDIDGFDNGLYPCWCDGRSGSQDVYVDPTTLNFFTDVSQISVATGGTASFTINIGPNYGGHDYLVLGSLSGTSPGINLPGGVHLPLNWDTFLTFTIVNAGSAVLPNSIGVLDSTGSSWAKLVIPGPLDPGLIGLAMDFSTLLAKGPFTFASNVTTVTLGP